MSQYYFLVASLPVLSYEEKDASEPSAFIELLQDHLAPADLATVSAASIDAPLDPVTTGQPTLDRWRSFERGVRNALVRLRAPGRSTEATTHLRLDAAGDDHADAVEIGDAARESFGQESPLSGEDQLSRARWAHLDELEVGHFFDLDRVIIYYLKLQILARRRLFNRSDGEERFAHINESIMNEYYQEQSE